MALFAENFQSIFSLSQDWSTSSAPVAQFFYLTTGMGGTVAGAGRFVSTVAVILVVVALAYFTTRLMANARLGRIGKRNLEIIETVGVGQHAFVHIMRVGGKFVMVGVTRAQVTFLAELDETELDISEAKRVNITFDTLLSRFRKNESESDQNQGGQQ